MNIQGDLFTDCYISDSIITEIKQHLLLETAVVGVRIDPELDTLHGELVITVVIAKCDDNTYDALNSYLFKYAEEINQRLGTSVWFSPEWLEYPNDFTTSFLRSFIMESTLKFFRVVISANRNYAEIDTTYYKHHFKLDEAEKHLLMRWFNKSSINESNMRLSVNLLDCIVLFFENCSLETYSCLDTLQERLYELEKFETALFAQLDYIKQPKF